MKLVISLTADEYEGLADIARDERRTVNQQAAHFVAIAVFRDKVRRGVAKQVNDTFAKFVDVVVPDIETASGRYIHLEQESGGQTFIDKVEMP